MQQFQLGSVPLAPTVKEELLFQTGAPELVVQKGELKALDGRCCITQTSKQTESNNRFTPYQLLNEAQISKF